MVTIITCAIIGLVIGVIIVIKDWNDFYDYVFGALTSLLVGLIGAVVGLIIGILIPAHFDIQKTEYEIVSIQDNESIKGKFFLLGSGYINGSMGYVFYTKNGDGFELSQLDADEATVYYTDSIPKCIKYEYVINDDMINNFSLGCSRYRPSYELYVPEGTITNNFKLDAK